MNRREFLLRAAAGLVVAGCGSSSSSSDLGTLPPRTDSAWDELQRALKGQVLRPGDPGFDGATLPQNLRYAHLRPAGVAVVQDAQDVAASLAWARRHGVPVVVRSGGHSYGGYSTTTGLTISTSALRAVTVQGGEVLIQPGAMNTDVYNGLEPFRMAVPAGRCPTVGFSGLVLGGGFGFSSRKLGLTCDTLLETEVVTVDGQVLRCSETENADLFWGCRGGGGGNFGVNMGYRCRLAPVRDVTVFKLSWPLAQAHEVLLTLDRLIDTAPDEFGVRGGVGVSGPFPRQFGDENANVNALGQLFGTRAELDALLAPLPRPAQADIRSLSFAESKDFFFATTPINRYAVKSAYLKGPLTEQAVTVLVDHVRRWPGSRNADGAGLAMFAMGGAVNRVAPQATAFVHRDSRWLLALETSWQDPDNEVVVEANLDWLDDLYAQLRPLVGREAYQNFIDPDLVDYLEAYYGANLPRLIALKRRYDPENVLRFPQSIPVG